MNKTWISKMLSASGEVSSKRVITVAAFLLLAVAFIADITKDVKMDPNLLKIMEYIVLGGLGFISVEKLFTPKSEVTVTNTEITVEK